MVSKNYILLVFEGEKTEKRIVDNLKKYYLNEGYSSIIYGLYGNVIYDVYEALHDEEGELLFDLFPILQDIPHNKETLKNIARDEVSEIYLFFDHDAHSHLADREKLTQMLRHFDNETEYGKLYISYPMVEALKHLSENINQKELTCLIDKNTKYKETVDAESENKYIHVKAYTQKIWEEIIDEHCRKLGFLCMNTFEPLCSSVTQEEIFHKQIEKYIKKKKSVAILSAFPIFLVDYYGYEYFDIC